MEAALEAEVSELRLTVASPTSMTVDGGDPSAEAEHERDENASPSRAVRSDAYWGSRGPRPVVRRADVAGVAPVREEETTSDTTSCNASHPSRRFRARRGRGGRDAGAPVAQATGDASPIVERPKWGGKYDDDGLRVSRYDFAYIVPKSNKSSSERRVQARRRSNEQELSTPPRDWRAEPRE